MSDDARGSAVFGHDVWQDPFSAKGMVGLLPDGLALPERVGVIVLVSVFALVPMTDPRQRARSAAAEPDHPVAARAVPAGAVANLRSNRAAVAGLP